MNACRDAIAIAQADAERCPQRGLAVALASPRTVKSVINQAS
jgi:hypothetical protein